MAAIKPEYSHNNTGLSARADKCGDILDQEKRLQQAKVLGGSILKYVSMMKREKCEYKNS